MNNALYYPYIHIRDEDWLKKSLLVFDQIKRIVPFPNNVQGDPEWLGKYQDTYGGRDKPFISNMELWSAPVENAQLLISARLREECKKSNFREKFSNIEQNDGLGFQIHIEKLHHELRSMLKETKLGWDPITREPYDDNGEYVQVHNKVGQLIMSTIAIAGAREEGLKIVGDKRSGRLHEALIKKESNELFEKILLDQVIETPTHKATNVEIFECIANFNLDTSNLSLQNLAELGQEKEALNELLNALSNLAKQVPEMGDNKERDEYIKSTANDAITKWSKDVNVTGSFFKNLIDVQSVTTATKLLEKFAVPLFVSEQAAKVANVTDPISYSILGGAFILIPHVATSYVKAKKSKTESPFRYLTYADNIGLTVRMV